MTPTMLFVFALLVVAVIWHLSSSSIREKTGQAGPWVVLIGWIILVVIGVILILKLLP